jgi:hypothetical protein
MFCGSSNHEGQDGRDIWYVEGLYGRISRKDYYLGDLGVDERIILKFILGKSKGMDTCRLLQAREPSNLTGGETVSQAELQSTEIANG